ncbi:condensin complex subunit 1 [Bombina bombina]|uniref:condensin complex subunit 1 n=1 Tax=Bombina bombina TaxID=8345 RepID=UPI00235A4F5E|nr:condensin complex subunit 1 [Bombina bombina]
MGDLFLDRGNDENLIHKEIDKTLEMTRESLLKPQEKVKKRNGDKLVFVSKYNELSTQIHKICRHWYILANCNSDIPEFQQTPMPAYRRVTVQESTAPSDERPADAPQDKETESVATSPEASDLGKQEMLVQYLTDAHHFALKIEEAIDVISRMMYEPAVSVVQEVIEFFVTVSQFGVSQALLGVRRMLPLVWSKEPGVREAVIGAYRRLYLSPSRESERLQAQGLICSLSLLMVDSSTALIQCLEEIVSEFVQKGDITPQVLQLLWEKFTLKSPCSPLERQASVMLLGMMSR